MAQMGERSLGSRLAAWVPWLPPLGVAIVMALFVWSQARHTVPDLERELQDSCLANMKSLALATLTYAQDWDGRLPPRPAHPVHRALREGGGVGAEVTDHFVPDDWRRQIRYPNGQVFICPSTGSIYSYDFNPQVYGVVAEKLDDPDNTVMEFENGFLTGRPRGPHRGGYTTTYCDGRGAWVPHALAPGDDIRLR